MGFNMRAAMMPEGVHLVEISDAKEGTSKGKNLKQWTVTLRSWDRPEETVLSWWPLEGPMTFKTRRYLALLGFASDAIVETQDLIGRKFYVAIKHEEYRGEMGAKVDERAEGSTNGIWPESAPPPQVEAQLASAAGIFDAEPLPKAEPANDLPRGHTVPWPPGVKKATDLPRDHPDYCAF